MERKITVKGIGHITAKPDLVVMNMSIDAVDKKYDKAVERVSKKINALSDALIKAGFERTALKTIDFRVNVNTEFKMNRKGVNEQVRNGFVCSNRMKLSFGFESDKLLKAINAISNCVSDPKLSIVFTVKDEEAVKDKLMQSAGENARRRAKILCEAAGGKLGNLITVNYNWNDISIFSETRFNPLCDTAVLDDCFVSKLLMAPKSMQPDDIELSDNAVFIWEIE